MIVLAEFNSKDFPTTVRSLEYSIKSAIEADLNKVNRLNHLDFVLKHFTDVVFEINEEHTFQLVVRGVSL